MSDGDLVPAEAVLHGEVLETDEEYLRIVYSNGGTEGSLVRYLDTGSGEDCGAVEVGLSSFCDVLAGVALKDGEVGVNLVRSAFDLVTGSMNEVASRKYGYVREGAVRSLLVRAGIKAPKPDSYVSYLDDRYWSSQFMDQYENGGMPMAPRQDEETDQEYLARYTYTCIHGLLFAPFTYLAD
jgi:hypothetical protein